MSVFPKISLKPEVTDYLRSVFLNKEVLDAVGHQEAECRFQKLLTCLSHPPSYTCVRASTHLAPLDEIRHKLGDELKKQQMCSSSEDISVQILPHPRIPDVLLLPVDGPRPVEQLGSEVVVGAQCGSAVLRGAHVFVPGIVASPKYMKAGDVVSVLSDVEGRCTRAATNFQGKKVFVGNGVAHTDRSSIFCTDEPAKGIGVRMVEPIYQSPSFDGVLPSLTFLQNLPSVVVGHVLGPLPGERILDMCAAPGGKTCHIAALMRDQGEVVALDRIRNKIDQIRQNAQMLHLRSIKAFCFNSTKAVSSEPAQEAEGPPFPPESFDRVLLDAPCSGLGQRPNMSCTWSLKEVCSYQPLQRKLFHAAVRLLKKGGVLVYSTCTVTLAENEEQVAWALHTFPCLTLLPQEPHVGAEGMLGAGLSPEQLRLLQRFSPELSWEQSGEAAPPLPCRADRDTIGFFIAKFLKN
ncbi:tRNA (cytosine(72)-C(5))-methyltransferase NSUN6 [Centropristis striata]|uniref:tRNA (cytosine(72)-C(5))-methyltransferase NSUN6 n=1 Tax=Centropristis striata TaxID=184440 RepID=UPI0027E17BC6|nr:tRNA (cytosine(72)-C(5))-methyltransferase NSUN6 [Centropristis striata]XP_059182618.1 tRNA (cytosine(72)-C(5))-methyltransferase NSUN6 [Centropristis striata]XP_059182619.1 tRNA (cytosine(72)-C(5))-methyltransferase NSUN6 [Centropristis striata]